MGEPASDPREVSHSQFRDNTVINQGDTHIHLPHKQARSPVHVIPYPRNEDVVYRPGIEAKLKALLPLRGRGSSAALWGLGGTGKTQIALNYAYERCNDPSCSVFWVHANSEATFSQDYKAIAKELDVNVDLKNEDLFFAVRDGIKAKPQWVLILDSADDLTLFGVGQADDHAKSWYKYIPQSSSGTVLWTSRDERIAGTLVGPRRGIEVDRMAPNEARELLAIAINNEATERDEGAVSLLDELQWLPLAISQAGAYMRRTSTSIEEYSRLLGENKLRWQVLKANEFDRHRRAGIPNSILETWSISIDRIRRDSKMAYRLLQVMAYFNNQNIEHELVVGAIKRDDDEVEDENSEDEEKSEVDEEHPPEDLQKLGITEAITRLKEYSFIRVRKMDDGSRSYDMHKLVQEATRYGLSVMNASDTAQETEPRGQSSNREGEVYFSGIAVQVVERVSPTSMRETWQLCEKYTPHAMQVAEWAELCGKHIRVSNLLTKVSNFLYDRGRWREKEPVDEKSWRLRQDVLGEKHPDTIRSMASLAVTYHSQGHYDKAEPMYVDALQLRREVLGEKHPDTISSIADLATTYHSQGHHNKAEPMKVDALQLRREVLGEKHPDTISSMASLAVTYHSQGYFDKAEPMYVKTLQLRREVLGEKHPDTISSMTDLTATYSAQGRYVTAELMNRKVTKLKWDALEGNE